MYAPKPMILSFCEQGFDDIRRLMLQDEFDDFGFRFELTQIRHEIAQAERSVEIAGVEGGEEMSAMV